GGSRSSWSLASSRNPPMVRQIALRRAQDFQYRTPIFGGKMKIVFCGALTAQDLPETLIHEILHCAGERIERPGIDLVAAWVAEQAGLQIEVAKGPAFRVARAARRKVARKGGSSLDRVGQTRLVLHEHVVHHLLGDAPDARPSAFGGLVGR